MVQIEVKDDFLLKKEVLPCKNATLVYKGKNLKIQRNIRIKSVFATSTWNLHEGIFVPFWVELWINNDVQAKYLVIADGFNQFHKLKC